MSVLLLRFQFVTRPPIRILQLFIFPSDGKNESQKLQISILTWKMLKTKIPLAISNFCYFFNTIRSSIIMKPTAVEFLVHMSLCAAVASVNSLAEECLVVDVAEKGDRVTRLSKSEHSGAARPAPIPHQRVEHTSITGARLDLQWRPLHNVEYLTDGGNSWIHTAVFNEKPVVVKTLKPECQDVAMAINEIEGELGMLQQKIFWK